MTSARLRGAALRALAALYAVMWVGGVMSYVLRGGPAVHEAWAAPAFLALAGLLMLVTSRPEQAAWLLAAMLIGFASEYLGVRCGCIFGRYSYTDVLLVAIAGVPIVMSVAWMILIAYVQQMLLLAGAGTWARVAGGGAWMTAIDLVIDPVAAGPLRYWIWQDPGAYYGIPLQNFAGWFAVSAAIFALLHERSWSPNAWARRIGISVVVFFSVIAAAKGLALCAAIGAGLVLLHVWAARRAGSTW